MQRDVTRSQGQSGILANIYASVGTPPGQFRESGFARLHGVLLGLEATCVIQDVTMLALLGKIHREEEHIFNQSKKKNYKKNKKP